MNDEENFSSEWADSEERSGSQSVRIRGLLRRAQIRIEFAGDDSDREDALSIINEALSLGATFNEASPLLQRLAEQSEDFAARVTEIEERLKPPSPPSVYPSDEADLEESHPDQPDTSLNRRANNTGTTSNCQSIE